MAKTLLLDLESAPKIAYVWQFWKAHVHPDQVVSDGFLMTGSWKWLGSDDVILATTRETIGDDRALTQVLASMLDSADVVIAHNAKKFDVPLFNSRCIIHGIKPPSPYKIIDTLEVARKKFRFDSNSLENLARVLGCTPKGKHKKFPGFLLWKACLEGNMEAWDEMEQYNLMDVVTLEEIYYKMRPWMDQHPNVANIEESGVACCTKCGSDNLTKRGVAHTAVGVYQRYRCNDCGGWSRGRKSLKEKAEGRALLVNAGVS